MTVCAQCLFLVVPWVGCGISWSYSLLFVTVKPVLSGHSKIDKTKVLKTNGGSMKGKSIAEGSLGAVCNTFDLH